MKQKNKIYRALLLAAVFVATNITANSAQANVNVSSYSELETAVAKATENEVITFTQNLIAPSDTDGSDYSHSITYKTDNLIIDGQGYNTVARFDYAKMTVNDGITVNLNYADNTVQTFSPISINVNSGKINLALDIKASTDTNDVIKTTNTSSGKIFINDINFIDYKDDNSTVVYKVLNTNEGLQLQLDNTKFKTHETLENTTIDTISANVDVTSNDQFKIHGQINSVYCDAALATSSGGTTNDSIAITYGAYNELGDFVDISLGDTIALWNQKDFTEDKNINLIPVYS